MSENDVRFLGVHTFIFIKEKITNDFAFYEFNALSRKEVI